MFHRLGLWGENRDNGQQNLRDLQLSLAPKLLHDRPPSIETDSLPLSIGREVGRGEASKNIEIITSPGQHVTMQR